MVLYPNKLPESERVCSGICTFTFGLKRKGVSDEMYLRLVSNVLAFWSKRKCVFYQDLFVSFLSCFIYCVGVILYFFLNEAVKYD